MRGWRRSMVVALGTFLLLLLALPRPGASWIIREKDRDGKIIVVKGMYPYIRCYGFYPKTYIVVEKRIRPWISVSGWLWLDPFLWWPPRTIVIEKTRVKEGERKEEAPRLMPEDSVILRAPEDSKLDKDIRSGRISLPKKETLIEAEVPAGTKAVRFTLEDKGGKRFVAKDSDPPFQVVLDPDILKGLMLPATLKADAIDRDGRITASAELKVE
jgi:hypothetical protein